MEQDMDLIDEQMEMRIAMQTKKERFRVEIRRSKQKEEFAMKRSKLMQRGASEIQPYLNSNHAGQDFQLNGINTDANGQYNNNINNLQLNKKGKFSEQDNSCEPKTSTPQYHSIDELLSQFKLDFKNGHSDGLLRSIGVIRKLIIDSLVHKTEVVQMLTQLSLDSEFLTIIQEILLISASHMKQIQCEALWILINICSGSANECWHLLKAGLLETFQKIMESSEDLDILESICWCLSNLAADDEQCRQYIFNDSAKILAMISSFYEKILLQKIGGMNRAINSSTKIIYELSFFLTILIKKHPMPSIEPLRKILSILKELFFLDIEEIKLLILKSFQVLISKNQSYIDELISINILEHIVPFLASSQVQVIKESLRLFTIIVSSSCEEFTLRMFVKPKFQAYVERALMNPSRIVKQSAVDFVLTLIEYSPGLNIVAEVILEERLIRQALDMVLSEEFRLKAKLMQFLLLFLRSDMGIQKLIEMNFIQVILHLLNCGHPEVQSHCLQSLDLMLEYGASIEDSYHDLQDENATSDFEGRPRNPVLTIFFNNSGQQVLESLQTSCADNIYKLTIMIIKKYFTNSSS